jgi:hypothetical protein
MSARAEDIADDKSERGRRGKPFTGADDPRRHKMGRPKGSRAVVSEAFLRDYARVWNAVGAQTLEQLAENDPATFVRVGASLVPKEIKADVQQLTQVVVSLVGGAADVAAQNERDAIDVTPEPPPALPERPPETLELRTLPNTPVEAGRGSRGRRRRRIIK